MVSHANLLANLEVLQYSLVPSGANLGVTWLPPYHDMGLIGGILLTLYSGIEAILMSPVSFLQRPRRWLEAISRTRATISGGPNFAYELLSQRLIALSRKEDTTLFMTLLAALNVLLYLQSGQSDIVVGSFVANRTRTETEQLIGLFANLVALRTRLDDGNIHFRELLRRVRATTLDAYAQQDIPFQRVVEQLHLPEDLSRTTLFQVMLIMQYAPPSSLLENWDDIAVQPLGDSWIEWDADLAPCDLELHMLEGLDERLYGDLCYSTDLFERSTIARLIERFQSMLEEIVSGPERLIKDFG